MQIIIPMSGVGQRFIDAGYKDIKPLVCVNEKPMVEYIVSLYPKDSKILFVCNNDHLKKTKLEEELKRIAPTCEIIGIEPHKKGPVYAVSQAFDYIDNNDEIIVQHVDTYKYWDFDKFLAHTRSRKADAAISANRGFHPNMFTGTNYALSNSLKQWMTSMTEKKPIEDIDREYASDGTYYFKNGSLVKKYFKQLMDLNINLKGEYYISLVYPLLLQDGLKVSIYEIQHLVSLGIPIDIENFRGWSNYFQNAINGYEKIKVEKNSINLIPLAGKGSRFVGAGYETPKPLIELSGKPMIIQASESLPDAEKRIFICLKEHLENYPLEHKIKESYPNAKIVKLNKVTEGQACTIEVGLKGADPDSPLMIGACDFGALWDRKKYQNLLDDKKVDAIVWSFRHHPNSKIHPEMYGWIKVGKNNKVEGISVKVPISNNPFDDHAFTGAMYFRKTKYFLDALKEMYKKNIRIKGEFYLDSCINVLVEKGLNVKVFEVDHFSCWGTPDELKTYEYWQSFFHKCDWHPYSLEKDPTIEKGWVNVLDKKYRTFKQVYK
ncbi:MAG: NTP transferase domain-containing protein [Patescibacteria group bacterium]|nr:NTP transferase domain-containing protein [Patescibacteria group bacterium]